MRPITVLRATAWFGFAVVVWSLNIRWGVDPNVPTGPPDQWQRHVVGAGLLALIAALAISVSGRKAIPPSNLARGVAVAASLLILLLLLLIRNSASASGFGHLLEGAGFWWMFSGSGLVLGSVVGTFALKAPATARSDASGNRKRGGGKSGKRGGKPAKKTGARK